MAPINILEVIKVLMKIFNEIHIKFQLYVHLLSIKLIYTTLTSKS